MRLFWSSRSPFVRKVLVVAHEVGLFHALTLERVVVSSSKPNAAVMAYNPLSKIPTLVLDGGEALYDSRTICEYLAATGNGAGLFPSGPARWTALRLAALGDGLMEVLIMRMGEGNRPAGSRSLPHEAAFRSKTVAVLDQLERESLVLASAPLHIGAIAIGCALSHLDFRFAEDEWRLGRPSLSRWHDGFGRRPSMQMTGFSNEY